MSTAERGRSRKIYPLRHSEWPSTFTAGIALILRRIWSLRRRGVRAKPALDCCSGGQSSRSRGLPALVPTPAQTKEIVDDGKSSTGAADLGICPRREPLSHYPTTAPGTAGRSDASYVWP